MMDGFDERFTLKLRSLGGWRRLLRFKVLNVFLTAGTIINFGYLEKGKYIYVLCLCYGVHGLVFCFLCLKVLY